MIKQYNENKLSKVGSLCKCPSCGTDFVKKHYQQVFCKSYGGTVCKDKYWNSITPNKRNNTTRISPANARYYNNVILPKIEEKYAIESLGLDYLLDCGDK